MANFHRLPAFPLIVNDPYFSIWSCSDHPTDTVTKHWAGQRKRLNGAVTIDGVSYRFLGPNDGLAMKMEDLTITPPPAISSAPPALPWPCALPLPCFSMIWTLCLRLSPLWILK